MSLHFVVDGYNCVRHTAYSRKNRSHDEKNGLLDFIVREHICGSRRNTVTVVFDGFPGEWKQREAGITVVFSGQTTADETIKRLTRCEKHPRQVVVVSDDREVRFFGRQDGCGVMGIEEFVSRSRSRLEAARRSAVNDNVKPDLSYGQMQKINRELSDRWLKKKGKQE